MQKINLGDVTSCTNDMPNERYGSRAYRPLRVDPYGSRVIRDPLHHYCFPLRESFFALQPRPIRTGKKMMEEEKEIDFVEKVNSLLGLYHLLYLERIQETFRSF